MDQDAFLHRLTIYLISKSEDFYEVYYMKTHLVFRDTWYAQLILFTLQDQSSDPLFLLLSSNLEEYWSLLWPHLFTAMEQVTHAAVAANNVLDDMLDFGHEDPAALDVPAQPINVFALDEWASGVAQHVYRILCCKVPPIAVNPTGPGHPPPPTAQIPDTEQLLYISQILCRLDFHEADSPLHAYLRSFHDQQRSTPIWQRAVTCGPPVNDTTSNFIGLVNKEQLLVTATNLCLPQYRQPPSVRIKDADPLAVQAMRNVTGSLWTGMSHFNGIFDLLYDENKLLAAIFDSAGNWDLVRQRVLLGITQNMLTGLRGMLPSMWADLTFFQYVLEAVDNVLVMVNTSDRPHSFTYTGTEQKVALRTDDPKKPLNILLGDSMITAPVLMSLQQRDVIADAIDIAGSLPELEEHNRCALDGNWVGFLRIASILPQNASPELKAIFDDGVIDGMYVRMLMQELGINGKRGVTSSFLPPYRLSGELYPMFPKNLLINIVSIAIAAGYLRFVENRSSDEIRNSDFDLRPILTVCDPVSCDAIDGLYHKANTSIEGLFYLRFLNDLWASLPILDCRILQPRTGIITQSDRHPSAWLQVPKPPPPMGLRRKMAVVGCFHRNIIPASGAVSRTQVGHTSTRVKMGYRAILLDDPPAARATQVNWMGLPN
ncbi:hypothetical protein DXG01_003542 [Tephrocybe rancida]|nr:hypothetical protein DXG01_003542 [Tephrocybe rancida]